MRIIPDTLNLSCLCIFVAQKASGAESLPTVNELDQMGSSRAEQLNIDAVCTFVGKP